MDSLIWQLLSRTAETEFIFGVFHLLLACLTLLVLLSWFRREPRRVGRPAHLLLIAGSAVFAVEFFLAALYSGAEFFFQREWNRLLFAQISHALAGGASLLVSVGLLVSVRDGPGKRVHWAIGASCGIGGLLIADILFHSELSLQALSDHSAITLATDATALAAPAVALLALLRSGHKWHAPPAVALGLILASTVFHFAHTCWRLLPSGVFWPRGVLSSADWRLLPSDVFWVGEQHLLSFGLFAFAWALGERSPDLFDRVFVRLNLTFILLASVMILSTVGMQRLEYLKLAEERTLSLGEYIRSHLTYYGRRGEELRAALEDRDLLRRIVVGFGEVPDLRRIEISLGDQLASFRYGADWVISHEFTRTRMRERSDPEDVPRGRLFRMLRLRITPSRGPDDRIDFYGTVESINRHIGTYIVLIYALFTVMVTVSVVMVGIIVRNADRAIQRQHAEIREIQRQLAQASKLASIGELAAGVAHEINNPVTSILSTATHLAEKQGATLGDRDRKQLNLIAEQAERISDIVTKLLTFSRQSRMELSLVDVNEVVETAVSLLEFRLQKSPVLVRRELSEDLPTVLGDANRLTEVFVNLINNALDAMPSGGTLTLRTEQTSERDLRIEISDTGCGIEAAALERIFDPFFTTKEPGKGTGLGLSISHAIIRDHGGEIRVESQPGHGSTFVVILPICGDPAQRSAFQCRSES